MVEFNDRRNGDTHYDVSTPVAVRQILDGRMGRRDQGRITVHYGNPESGQAWGDQESGYVSRSSGEKKIPILTHNSRSMGGFGMLDKNIVKIETARKNRNGSRTVLWQHPNYTEPQ